MLMFGVFVNAPWLIPALATGLVLFLLYIIVQETYNTHVAMIAVILGLVSPATLCTGANWFSEGVSRLYLAIYILALIRTLKRTETQPNKIYPILSGFALGYAFSTRPMPTLAFGIAGAGLTVYWIIRSPDKMMILKRIFIFSVPFAFMIGMCMAWNAYFTGNPLKFTHNAAQPYDKIGFGKRTEGYEPDLEHAFVFTPKYALERTWRHILPCVSFNTLGWGYYRSDLFHSYRSHQERFLTLRVIPLSFPFILMLIPLFHPSRNRYDVFFLAFFMLNMLVYFFFYFEGSTWGFTPGNARYYTECTMLGIIPLIARGMFVFYGWIRKIPSKVPIMILALLLILLSINTVHNYVRIGKPYRNWSDVYQKLPQLVKQQDIHYAVIFIPHTREAPIGDYPFQDLETADIAYFKLGPDKVWRLTNSNWRDAYEQYFKGRHAYMYENGTLRPL